MSKRKFLELLDKKLLVLNEEERNDILNEYEDIIDEKMKNGESLSEAILSFGDLDELVSEILSAYKINPNYNKNNSSKTSFEEGTEKLGGFIKASALKLSVFFRNLIDDLKEKNINFKMEEVFEFIIKFILILIGLAILRIPFYILENFLINILRPNISGIDFAVKILVRFIGWVCYIIPSAIIVYVFIRKTISNIVCKDEVDGDNTENDNNNNKSAAGKKKDNAAKIDEKEELSIKEDSTDYLKKEHQKYVESRKRDNEANEVKVKSTFGRVSLFVLKILAFFICYLPGLFSIVGFIMALCVLIFLMTKGLFLFGPIIIIVGFIIAGTSLFNFVSNLIFKNRIKFKLHGVMIGFIFTIVGSILSISTIQNIRVYDHIPENIFPVSNVEYVEKIDEDTIIDAGERVNIQIDESIADNEVEISVTYYSDVIDIKKILYTEDNKSVIKLETKPIYFSSQFLDKIIESIKDDRLYKFDDFYEIKVIVRVNSNTRNMIRID